jgi:hypothetical protein
MTAALFTLDESDHLAPPSADTGPEPDHVGCGCVAMFREAEVPQPRTAADLVAADLVAAERDSEPGERSLTEGAQP